MTWQQTSPNPVLEGGIERPAASIGVFDSGLGGLSVLRALRLQLPSVGVHYIADSAHAPYGDKPADQILARSMLLCETLLEQGAQLIVVACNTATVHAIEGLRQRWPAVPFVGTEPGIKPAVQASKNGRIGVLATAATLASPRYLALRKTHGAQTQIVEQACVGLADLIEAKGVDSPELDALIQRYCQPLAQAQVDTVLLGCTHYPLVQTLIQAQLGPHVQLLNVEDAVARQAHKLWLQWQTQHPDWPVNSRIQLWSTGNTAVLDTMAHRVLPHLAGGATPIKTQALDGGGSLYAR
ncbi:glutamate racemase [Roseateles sp. BYS180W]|uniref:Glutamate racemase n=1 Tax=Roseateles rivi TaxID=3299028 RepID=A0ABW7FVV7_9BURK